MPTWKMRPVSLGDLGQHLALVDREGHRLLAVDILSSAHGFDGDQGVPVVGRDDGNGVDVFAFEQMRKSPYSSMP